MTRTAFRTSFSTQAAAFALAAVTTLGLMASIDNLAATPAPEQMMAQAADSTDAATAPMVVVVTGKRLAQNG